MGLDDSFLNGDSAPNTVMQPEAAPISATAPSAAPVAGTAAESAQNALAAQPSQRPWARVLQGALWGLTGIEKQGRGGFGVGLGQGVKGAMQGEIQQQQLRFASVKAADDHVRAMKEQQLLDVQTDEARLSFQLQKQNIDALNKIYGLGPDGTISADNPNDLHGKAIGAMKTMAAASPDGTLQRVQTVGSPYGGSQAEHVIDYYNPPTAQKLQQNPNGYKGIVSEAFKADGKVLTDQFWLTGGGAMKPGDKPNAIGMLAQQQTGQQEMVMNAYKRLYSPFGGEELITKSDRGAMAPADIVAQNTGSSAHLHQAADAYDKLEDANPTVSKLLHGQATNFDAAVEKARQDAQAAVNKSTREGAPAQAEAAAQKTTAEQKAEQPFKEAFARYEQTVKDGDPAAAGALLAQGLVAPSELVSARQPAFAEAAFKAANDYSMKNTGKPFNAQVQEGYFVAAKSQSNVQFFGSAKSLTDQGGTLDQLTAAGPKISQNDWQILNKTKNWAELQAGKGGISGYGATAVGVADDYAKVMGGGTGSDTARDMVLKAIDPSASPEQRQAAVNAMRRAVWSQMSGRIGNNTVMGAMYGDQIADSTVRASDQKLHWANSKTHQIFGLAE